MTEKVQTLAQSSGPLLQRTWEALHALDPARFDTGNTTEVRDSLVEVRDGLSDLPDAAGPLPDALQDLRDTLDALPQDDAPEAWESFRTTLEPRYEEVAQHLTRFDVDVPNLRPTNYTRSIVHALSAMAVVVFVELADERLILWTASCAFAFAMFLETSRRVSDRWNDVLMKVLGPIAHPAERYRINSASNYILALFVLAWMGYPATGAVGVAVLGLADPAASFVGRRWGRTSLIHGRTLEGSIAFVATAVVTGIAVLALFHGEITAPAAAAMAGAAAVAGALAELASGRIDDNLTIPVISGAAAWGVAILMDAPLLGFG